VATLLTENMPVIGFETASSGGAVDIPASLALLLADEQQQAIAAAEASGTDHIVATAAGLFPQSAFQSSSAEVSSDTPTPSLAPFGSVVGERSGPGSGSGSGPDHAVSPRVARQLSWLASARSGSSAGVPLSAAFPQSTDVMIGAEPNSRCGCLTCTSVRQPGASGCCLHGCCWTDRHLALHTGTQPYAVFTAPTQIPCM
jgi:hypothetical protein